MWGQEGVGMSISWVVAGEYVGVGTVGGIFGQVRTYDGWGWGQVGDRWGVGC